LITNFHDLRKAAKIQGPKTISVACANDSDVLQAIETARKEGIVEAILVGDRNEIERIATKADIDLANYNLIDIKDDIQACLKSVELVSMGQAHVVMKGFVDTSIILKAVLDKNVGLRTGNVLSHVAALAVPNYSKILMVTDAAMNIAPDVQVKKQIVENTLVVANALGIEIPKVGAICAKEKVNKKMQATLDAAELVRMNEMGEIKNCIIGGPFALDNAVSKKAAEIKNIDHPAAGDCDILLAPTIEAGNVLYKALNFLCSAQSAGVIVGAKAPVVLTSRADSDASKLNSIALGVLMAVKM